MKRWVFGLLALACMHAVAPTVAAEDYPTLRLEAKGEAKPLSDAKIKGILIEESIASYSGNCPCPYSVARNGSRCGRRSAHSREGGAAPLCYPSDVSAEMVREYRETH